MKALGNGPPGSPPRRLVHVTTTDMSLDWLLRPQLEAFAAAGYEVFGASAPGPHVAALEASGITHLPLRHATRAMAPHHDLAALAELTRLFRRVRPHIVHTHNPKPGLYGRLAARCARVPVIVNTIHGLYATPDDSLARRGVVYALERVAATCSQAELLQNEEDLPVLRRLRVPESRLVLLGNGVDLDRFDPSAERLVDARQAVRSELGVADAEVLVGAVGRLVAEKGYAELFEAFRSLRSDGLPARLVVVGPDDPDKPDALHTGVRRRAEACGVVFLGHRDDVERIYRALDLYVLASWREGFPRSAMEAAAMALPIVTTDVRGCRQVVRDGKTGRLVPVRDPSAIAGALAELVADPDRRAGMGAAARELAVEQFDQRRIIATTLDVYERLLDRRLPANDT